jgi:hypothetical protein
MSTNLGHYLRGKGEPGIRRTLERPTGTVGQPRHHDDLPGGPPVEADPRHVAPGPPVGPAVLLPERRDVVGIGGVHIHPRFDFAMEEVDPSARHHAREVATLLQRAKRAGVRDLDERLDGLSPSRSAAHERGHAEADHQPSDPPPCHG